VEDIAKRIIDYGFHPTVSSPSRHLDDELRERVEEELDRFCDALISIRRKSEKWRTDAARSNNLLTNARTRWRPHRRRVGPPYSVSCRFPPFGRGRTKCAVGERVTAVRRSNLVCVCPPMEAMRSPRLSGMRFHLPSTPPAAPARKHGDRRGAARPGRRHGASFCGCTASTRLSVPGRNEPAATTITPRSRGVGSTSCGDRGCRAVWHEHEVTYAVAPGAAFGSLRNAYHTSMNGSPPRLSSVPMHPRAPPTSTSGRVDPPVLLRDSGRASTRHRSQAGGLGASQKRGAFLQAWSILSTARKRSLQPSAHPTSQVRHHAFRELGRRVTWDEVVERSCRRGVTKALPQPSPTSQPPQLAFGPGAARRRVKS